MSHLPCVVSSGEQGSKAFPSTSKQEFPNPHMYPCPFPLWPSDESRILLLIADRSSCGTGDAVQPHTAHRGTHLFLLTCTWIHFSCALSETSYCFLDAVSWFYLSSVYDLSCSCLWPFHGCVPLHLLKTSFTLTQCSETIWNGHFICFPFILSTYLTQSPISFCCLNHFSQ